MRKNNFLMVYKDKHCLIIFICRRVTSVHKYMICLQFCYAESFQPQKFCWKMLFEASYFRGRPFDFWEGGGGRGGGGVLVISRRRKPCKEIPRGKKFLHWKKNLSWGIILEKKSCTVVCQGKNSISRGLEEKILTQNKSPISPFPLKSQAYGLEHLMVKP